MVGVGTSPNAGKGDNATTAATHDYQILITLFAETFYQDFNTRLLKGTDEPVYLPADPQHSYHRIVFAHGFFASALHEIAHWCLAGTQRRTQVDYGYWYCPDGRNAQQQAEFERVEIKPQALEWCFSVACRFPFRVSVDNVTGDPTDRSGFHAQVYQQVQMYLTTALPERAARFVAVLRAHYRTPPLLLTQFQRPSP